MSHFRILRGGQMEEEGKNSKQPDSKSDRKSLSKEGSQKQGLEINPAWKDLEKQWGGVGRIYRLRRAN